MQLACRALAGAWAKTGKRIAARIAMMAMTTRSSMSVNAFLQRTAIVASFRAFVLAPEVRGLASTSATTTRYSSLDAKICLPVYHAAGPVTLIMGADRQ